jgi:hypothetical protein
VAEGTTERGKVTDVPTRLLIVSRTDGKYLVPANTFIKNNALNWRHMIRSVCKFNFFNSSVIMVVHFIKNHIVANGFKSSLNALKFIGGSGNNNNNNNNNNKKKKKKKNNLGVLKCVIRLSQHTEKTTPLWANSQKPTYTDRLPTSFRQVVVTSLQNLDFCN